MDPISIIITAIVLGAAAGLKPVTEQTIQDAYNGLKRLVQDKYADTRVAIDLLEKDPKSKAYQEAAQEMFSQTSLGKDEDVLLKAKSVLDAVAKHAPETAQVVGVRLEDVKGASLTIADIISSGSGVDLKKTNISGDIEIKHVRAGDLHQSDSNS
jgi:hypothetical protein